MKLKEILFRIKLEKSDFYEDITFQNEILAKDVKRIVTKWIMNLQNYKEIKIEKFKDLFCKLDEIVFPIKIKDSVVSSCLEIRFTDKCGKKYYMSNRHISDYNEMENYIIGRRNSSLEPLVDRDFHYRLLKDGTIVLKETGAMQLNFNGANKDTVVEFEYDYERSIMDVTLKSFEFSDRIEMGYPIINEEFDKKVLEFLFKINEENWYYYDVTPILKWLVNEISAEKPSIYITARVDGEICSEVVVVNGIVQEYIETMIVNEGEMLINKKIFAQDLHEFLKAN